MKRRNLNLMKNNLISSLIPKLLMKNSSSRKNILNWKTNFNQKYLRWVFTIWISTKNYLNINPKSFQKQKTMARIKITNKTSKIQLNFNNKEIRVRFQEICTSICNLMDRPLKLTGAGKMAWIQKKRNNQLIIRSSARTGDSSQIIITPNKFQLTNHNSLLSNLTHKTKTTNTTSTTNYTSMMKNIT